ncbi:MAG: CHAT domain-containing protein [Crocinitomix sp.]|jgi:CHAT domain-containing protein
MRCFLLTLSLLFSFASFGAANDILDSLLSELSALEFQNSTEDLRKKAGICSDLSDEYNLKYGDQDYSRTYLLQSKAFLEEIIKNKSNTIPEDLINLTDGYRKLFLYELSRGKLEASEEYLAQYENLLRGMKGRVSKEAYNQAQYEYNHSMFGKSLMAGDFHKGGEYLDIALDIASSDSNLFLWRASIMSVQSVCHTGKGEHEEAIAVAKKARELYETEIRPEMPLDRFVFFELRAMKAAGKFESIIKHIEQFSAYDNLESMETYLDENKEMVTRSFFLNIFLVGSAYRELYKVNNEKELIEASFKWICTGFNIGEKLTVKNDGDRIGNIILKPKEKIVSLLETYSELSNNYGANDTGVIEIIRILDSYQSSRLHQERVSNSVNSEMWAREKEIKNEITFINSKIEEYGQSPEYESEIKASNQRFNELSNELAQIKKKNKKEKVLEAYKLNSSEYSGVLTSHLNKHSVTLLTYFYANEIETLFIIGLDKDSAFYEAIVIPDFVNNIEESYQLNSALQTEVEAIEKQKHLNNLLYKYLIAPVENHLETHQLLIYPLNELSFVSFDALIDDDQAYLIHAYNFQYTSSIFSIISEKREKLENNEVLSFYPSNYGNDSLVKLFNAQGEVQQIGELIGATTLKEKEASKSNFLNYASGKKLVHLATHSVLNFEKPYESYILFEATNDSVDNKLYAYEIFPQIIDCEMVTLSSCNSAKGKIEEGIGLVSLANAFYFAGVPATVSSMWSAQDKSSSEIMVDFYANLKLGLSKSESMQRAKIAYLSKADKLKKQPFFWANYVVYGSDQPLYEKGGSASWWKYLFGTGLVIVLLVLGRKLF